MPMFKLMLLIRAYCNVVTKITLPRKPYLAFDSLNYVSLQYDSRYRIIRGFLQTEVQLVA